MTARLLLLWAALYVCALIVLTDPFAAVRIARVLGW